MDGNIYFIFLVFSTMQKNSEMLSWDQLTLLYVVFNLFLSYPSHLIYYFNFTVYWFQKWCPKCPIVVTKTRTKGRKKSRTMTLLKKESMQVRWDGCEEVSPWPMPQTVAWDENANMSMTVGWTAEGHMERGVPFSQRPSKKIQGPQQHHIVSLNNVTMIWRWLFWFFILNGHLWITYILFCLHSSKVIQIYWFRSPYMDIQISRSKSLLLN